MSLLGSLLYPDNPELAQELNDAQTQLEKTNNLHNTLVNSYWVLGESIKTFDAYLMSLMVLHYHLAYTAKDLSSLPDVELPELSECFADKIQSAALDALTVKMAVDGFKAIKARVGNLVREGGIFRRTAAQGTKTAGTEISKELDTIATRTPALQSGKIDVLTTTKTGPALEGMAGELGGEAKAVTQVVEAAKAEGVVTPAMESAAAIAEDSTTVAKAGSEAAKVADAGAATGGLSALLGPALLVVTAVTEVLSLIHDKQEHAKLLEAEAQLQGLQHQSDNALEDLKRVFRTLLNAGKTDIDVYNTLLPDLKAIEESGSFDRTFSTHGLRMYISGMAGITTEVAGAVPGYQEAAMQNLEDATDFIRAHATRESEMTDVIQKIKGHMEKGGLTTLDDNDPYLVELADVEGLDLHVVQQYNQFRVVISEEAAALQPYHEQVSQETKPGASWLAQPATPVFGRRDPAFSPKPADFKLPTIGAVAGV